MVRPHNGVGREGAGCDGTSMCQRRANMATQRTWSHSRSDERAWSTLASMVQQGNKQGSMVLALAGAQPQMCSVARAHYVEIPAVQSHQQNPSVENSKKKKVHMYAYTS